MASNPHSGGLRFGIEIECVAKFRPEAPWADKGFFDKAREIHKAIDGGPGRPISAYVSKEKEGRWVEPNDKYSKWAICWDSMDVDSKRGYGPLELISPILRIGREHKKDSLGEVEELWMRLTQPGKSFTIETTDQCSTQIHMSPIRGKWNESDFKKIGLAVLDLAAPILDIMPRIRLSEYSRLADEYFKDNRYNDELQFRYSDQTYEGHRQRMFRSVRAAHGTGGVAYQLCCSGVSPGRQFAWNFTGGKQLDDPTGTIEFRLPPGSRNARDSVTWIVFACAFVQAALEEGEDKYDDNYATHYPTSADLLGHVLKGVTALGLEGKYADYMKELIEGQVIAKCDDWPKMSGSSESSPDRR